VQVHYEGSILGTRTESIERVVTLRHRSNLAGVCTSSCEKTLEHASDSRNVLQSITDSSDHEI